MIRDTLVEVTSLKRKLEDNTLEGVWAERAGETKTLADWILGFVAQPHPNVGRSGPVCPATPPAIRQGTFYCAMSSRSPHETDALEAEILDLLDFVEALEPREGRAAELRTVTIALPAWLELGSDVGAAINRVHQKLKPRFVDRGFMLGEFYPGHPSPGIRNSTFRPLASPMPAFVIRPMVALDLIFLATNTAYLETYFKRFGP